MKNSKLLILAAVVIVIIVAAVFYISSKSQKPQEQVVNEEEQQELKTMTAEDIGLTLTPRSDKKAIVMIVTKLDGIKSIEYEVSYDAEVVEEREKITVPRGVLSQIEIEPGSSKVRREIELGTCSKNVCKYDKVVSDVKFVVKVIFKNGEIGSIEETVTL